METIRDEEEVRERRKLSMLKKQEQEELDRLILIQEQERQAAFKRRHDE